MTKIASPIGRSVKEWIGKNPDHRPPPTVRVRIFDRAGGACHLCKLAIKAGETWHCDHVKALADGGENRESNLAPAHADCNMAKAAGEKKRAAKATRSRAAHIGAKAEPGVKIQSVGFPKPERPSKLSKITPRKRPLYVASEEA